MAQTQAASLAKWRGRHYAARVRAASQQQQQQRPEGSGPAEAPAPAAQVRSGPSHARGLAPNESLTRRLQNSRFHNPRFQPSAGGVGGGTAGRSNTGNTTASEIRNASHSHHFVGKSDPASADAQSGTNDDNNNANGNNNAGGSSEMELVRGISDRLETGLNDAALSAILELLERGEHPESIVAVVTSLAQRPR